MCRLDQPGADRSPLAVPLLRSRSSPALIALAHNVGSRSEVDHVMATAAQAGAVVTREAAETVYGGWAGVFTDPDGHAREIAHDPGFTLAEDGTVAFPDSTQS